MQTKYTKSAMKNIKTLSGTIKERIKASILKIPHGDIKKLKGQINTYRLRVGDYRILYKYIDKDTIIILAVLPREKAYKNI